MQYVDYKSPKIFKVTTEAIFEPEQRFTSFQGS